MHRAAHVGLGVVDELPRVLWQKIVVVGFIGVDLRSWRDVLTNLIVGMEFFASGITLARTSLVFRSSNPITIAFPVMPPCDISPLMYLRIFFS